MYDVGMLGIAPTLDHAIVPLSEMSIFVEGLVSGSFPVRSI